MPLVVYSPGVNPQEVETVIYTPIDRKNWVYQPNFVRWRHRNRGPRESLKINQELSQTFYDLNVLNSRLEIAQDNLEFIVSQAVDGGDVDGVLYLWEDDATPSELPLELTGINTLGSEYEALRRRLEKLEG